MTVYEKIKTLTISEMATLIARMVDHESERLRCSCPIGSCAAGEENDGFCGMYRKGCDESSMDWLKSEDELFVDVPEYLREDNVE